MSLPWNMKTGHPHSHMTHDKCSILAHAQTTSTSSVFAYHRGRSLVLCTPSFRGLPQSLWPQTGSRDTFCYWAGLKSGPPWSPQNTKEPEPWWMSLRDLVSYRKGASKIRQWFSSTLSDFCQLPKISTSPLLWNPDNKDYPYHLVHGLYKPSCLQLFLTFFTSLSGFTSTRMRRILQQLW